MTESQLEVRALRNISEGARIGTSEMFSVSQKEINQFGKLTRDTQWIHLDQSRAGNGPFGGTIVHGYFLLSLLPEMTKSVVDFSTMGAVINYGLNSVRFIKPLRPERLFFDEIYLKSRESKTAGVLFQLRHLIRDQDNRELLCVAESLSLVSNIENQ